MNALQHPAFIGWYRRDRRSPWRAVVADNDESKCLNHLSDTVAGGDKVVLPRGENPNERERVGAFQRRQPLSN